MKPLSLEETKLKEEMKNNCLKKGKYNDDKAKEKFKMLCHLEDFEIEYWNLQQENKQLKDNWKKLRDFLEKELGDRINPNKDKWLTGVYDAYRETIDKMQKIEQGSDSDGQ